MERNRVTSINAAQLRLLVHLSKRKAPLKRQRKILQPDAQRLGYFSALRKGPVATLREVVKRIILPALAGLAATEARADGVRLDAKSPARSLTDKALRAWSTRWSEDRIGDLVQPWAQQTAGLSREQIQGLMADNLGIKVDLAEPNIKSALSDWRDTNVELIRDIPKKALGQMADVLKQGMAEGKRPEDMADDIMERLDVSESRANLIARDQVGKLYGEVNKARYEDLGLTKYIWRTMNDNRVRDEHEEREGETYEMGELGDDEEPGQPVNCRCYMEPVIDDVFDTSPSTEG